MSYALARRLLRAVKNAGVKYKEVEGWESRGHGSMGSIQSVMCHHTAGPENGDHPSLNVVTHGRSNLSGPLAQLFLSREDPTVYLVAAGRAYHAGRVSSSRYQNTHSVGIEAEATGVDSWSKEQIEVYAKLCKALIKEFGLPTSRVVGHKEKAVPHGRKIDPNFSMSEFRAKVGGAKGGVSSNTGGAGSSKKYTTPGKNDPLGLYDKGSRVKDWQEFLLDEGYTLPDGADGYFGPDTVTATKKYQESVGVTADGLVGPDTLNADGTAPSKPTAPEKVPGRKYAFPYESDGYIGPLDGPDHSHSGIGGRKTGGILDQTHNKRWVNQLENRGWEPEQDYLVKFGNDGKYGDELESLIRAFQKDQNLAVDGLAGKSTWDAAFKNPVS